MACKQLQYSTFSSYSTSTYFEYLRMRNFFGLFHLFTLVLEEFDYAARVQHVLHTTGCSCAGVVLNNISLCRLIRVFY